MNREPLQPGDRFGRFLVERELGRGGMGAVLLAHDETLDRPVALKFPLQQKLGDPQIVKRFLREAKAVARLRHPNVCPVYEAGQIDGKHYLAMAYIEGRSLDDLLRDEGRLPQRSVAELVRKLALALQTAHDVSLVHRDVKPSNVVVEPNGDPVLMDFGLAFPMSTEESRITRIGAIVGTPAYMAPELFDEDCEATPRSDVYSLGVLLYELLTGRTPYHGRSLTALIGQIVAADVPSPSRLRPAINPELARICKTSMAKVPSQRHSTALEFANELSSVLDRLPDTVEPDPEPEPTGGELGTLNDTRTVETLDDADATDVEDTEPAAVPPEDDFLLFAAGALVAILSGSMLSVLAYVFAIVQVVVHGHGR